MTDEISRASTDDTPPSGTPAFDPQKRAGRLLGKSARVDMRHGPQPGIATLPAAILELIAAAVVLPRASAAPDMAVVVYATAFLLGLMCVWIFHHLAREGKIWLELALLITKTPFSLLLMFVLWERHTPHRVWSGKEFYETEQALELLLGAGLLGLSLALLVAFRVLQRLFRIWLLARRMPKQLLESHSEDDAEEKSP